MTIDVVVPSLGHHTKEQFAMKLYAYALALLDAPEGGYATKEDKMEVYYEKLLALAKGEIPMAKVTFTEIEVDDKQ